MNDRKELMKEIDEISKIIQNFAERDLYSANCEEVKYLYKRKRRLEAIVDEIDYEESVEDSYEPQFIDGSDVPINGEYE